MLRSALVAFGRRRFARTAAAAGARRALSTAAADAAAGAGASSGAAAKPRDWKAIGRKAGYVVGALAVFDAVTYANYVYTVPRRLYRNALESVRHDERVLAAVGSGAREVSAPQFLKPFDRKAGEVAYTVTLEGSKLIGADAATKQKGKPARATLLVALDTSSGRWKPSNVRFAPHSADGSDGQAIDVTEAAAGSFVRRMDADTSRSVGELVWGGILAPAPRARAHAADH